MTAMTVDFKAKIEQSNENDNLKNFVKSCTFANFLIISYKGNMINIIGTGISKIQSKKNNDHAEQTKK